MSLSTTTPENTWGSVRVSQYASSIVNPIRAITDSGRWKENPNKSVIRLSLGDPTVFGNFPYPVVLREAMHDALNSGNAGYVQAHGTEAARAAVATKLSNGNSHLTSDDITITSGCSHALHIAFSALCNPGDNILIPVPGFSAYETISQALGITCRYYKLDPTKNWQVDMSTLAPLIDERTRLILINNPSNPCGSVYTRAHLGELLRFASQHHLPIVADEIYADMVFGGAEFVPMSSLTSDVPLLVVGGIAKQYLVPGWRVGWLAVVDRNGVLARARVPNGIRSLAQVLIGANTLVQAALPKLLRDTPKEFFASTLNQLESNCKIVNTILGAVKGLNPITPHGAMYMMIGIDTSIVR